jgi:hypothetical protein
MRKVKIKKLLDKNITYKFYYVVVRGNNDEVFGQVRYWVCPWCKFFQSAADNVVFCEVCHDGTLTEEEIRKNKLLFTNDYMPDKKEKIDKSWYISYQSREKVLRKRTEWMKRKFWFK